MKQCECIIQNGPRKEEICGANVVEGRKRCWRHKKSCILKKKVSPERKSKSPSPPKKSPIKNHKSSSERKSKSPSPPHRRTVRQHQSPLIGGAELDLNLAKKLQPQMEKLSQIERVIWKKHTEVEFGMKKILRPIKERIKRVYSELGDCFLEPIMHIGLPEGVIYFRKETEAVDKLDFESVIGMIQKCIKAEETKIVAMRVEVHKQGLETHAHALVINKKMKNKVVEIYDPNGHEIHRKWYGDEVISSLKKMFQAVDSNYIIAPIEKINPPKGLQYYENQARRYGAELNDEKFERYTYIQDYIEDGLCQAWSLYIIELRALNSDMPASHFSVRMQNRMNAVLKKSNADLSGDPIANYIISYLYAGHRQLEKL